MRIAILIGFLLLTGSAFASTPETIILDVQSMSCAVCPITVKKALEKVPGVNKVTIDFKHKTATVQLDLDRADAAALAKATTAAGFPSTVRK